MTDQQYQEFNRLKAAIFGDLAEISTVAAEIEQEKEYLFAISTRVNGDLAAVRDLDDDQLGLLLRPVRLWTLFESLTDLAEQSRGLDQGTPN